MTAAWPAWSVPGAAGRGRKSGEGAPLSCGLAEMRMLRSAWSSASATAEPPPCARRSKPGIQRTSSVSVVGIGTWLVGHW